MHPWLLIPILSCVAAVAIASAILARDPGQRANRLVALVLLGSAYWSLCEVIWNLAADAGTAARWIRLSSVGWLWMGPLCLDLYTEILGDARSRLRRLIPFAYATAVCLIVPYATTPWFVDSAVPMKGGWGIHFGPLFALAYVPTLACVCIVLIALPRFIAGQISRGERRQARWLFASIAIPLSLASVTDAFLPLFDIQVPRLGSASLLMLGAIVAWNIRRDGYLMLAPGAFTQEILETLRDGIALVQPDGRIRSCNGGLAQMAGATRDELRQLPVSEILPALAEEPCREMRDLDATLEPLDGNQAIDGIPVSLSTSRLRDDKGALLGCVLAVQDMREVVGLRGRLVTAGRLAAVGELAAGIAHEINNPATWVRSNLMELRRHWQGLAEGVGAVAAGEAPKDPGDDLGEVFAEGEELIEESVEGVERVAAIVRDIGAFAHAGRGRSELADLNQLLENAANVAALRYTITVERCYGDIPLVRCAPHQIRQLFLNLLFNALQAVDESGRIRLVTQVHDGYVTVRVEDDGCGMPPEVLERVFDPFFTTRPAGEGTGLGLALAYQIVRSHAGDISVESRPGRGTAFLIRLPTADADPVAA